MVWDVEWKSKKPCGKNQVDPRMELQRSNGNQFAELDSDCQGNNQFQFDKPINQEKTKTGISQLVTLKYGSYYKLTFKIKKRKNSVEENLRVSIEKRKKIIKNSDLTLEWQEKKILFRAGDKEINQDGTTLIKFDPLKGKSDSFGLLIDDIRLVEIEGESGMTNVCSSIHSVVSYSPKGQVSQDRQNIEEVLGESDGEPYSPNDINFVSLGLGGEIIVEFKPSIKNKSGNDLRLFETSGGNLTFEQYPEEAEVYASNDLNNWKLLGVVKNDNQNPSLGEVDLGSMKKAKYIKLIDKTNNASSDGYDLDAGKCLNQEEYTWNTKLLYFDKTNFDLYKVKNKKEKIRLKEFGMKSSNMKGVHIALSPNKKQLFSVEDRSPNSVYIWDLKDKTQTKMMDLNLNKVTMAGMSSSKTLYVGDMNTDEIYKVNLEESKIESLGKVYLNNEVIDLSGGDLEFTDLKMYIVTKSKGGQLLEVDLINNKLEASLLLDKIGAVSGLSILNYNHYLMSLSNSAKMIEYKDGILKEKELEGDLCIQGSGADLTSNAPKLPSKF